MPNGTYGGVRGRKTKVGRKLLRFPPTRFCIIFSNIGLTQGFSSMNLTTLRKSVQRFNNSILGGAKQTVIFGGLFLFF